MRARKRLRDTLLRSIPILLLGAVIGAAFLSPVSAHFTTSPKHLGKHAWKQTVKKKADKRYARGNLKYIRSDSLNVGNGLDRTIEVACPNGWHTRPPEALLDPAAYRSRLLILPMATVCPDTAHGG